MENASKALIIAGAILLSILLISLGIMIFNQAQSAIDGSGMSDAQLTAFNAKWLKYEGKQKGSTIRAMVQEVMANNNRDDASDETRVAINCGFPIDKDGGLNPAENYNAGLIYLIPASNEQPVYGNSFSNTKTYEVILGYYKGRIQMITVK